MKTEAKTKKLEIKKISISHLSKIVGGTPNCPKETLAGPCVSKPICGEVSPNITNQQF